MTTPEDGTLDKPHRSMDAIGMPCPLPIIKIMEVLAQMEEGQVLEVVSDEPAVQDDVVSVCSRVGAEYLGMEQDDGLYRARLRKKAPVL